MASTYRPVVLVHGAWMGAAAWDKVVRELASHGVPVTAVELPGHGADATPPAQLTLDRYVAAVGQALPAGEPVVLVGHSLAGVVVSAVAESVPERIACLVYVSAYLPRDGESLYQLSQTDADSLVPQYWRQENPAAYSPAWIAPEGIAAVFAADASADDQEWLVRTHRAEALAPMATPVHLSDARFGRVPRIYVHTTQDRTVSFALQQRMVAASGPMARVAQLDTSHVPMLTRPVELAAIIREAAQAEGA